ncbi:MAG: GPR endopeptidase [Clostridia bacterium]|nr:GPR endopeptidase [Clostridia bacterium]
MKDFFSDLALDERDRNISGGGNEKGYNVSERTKEGVKITRVEVTSLDGEKALNREKGLYSTVEIEDFAVPEEDFPSVVRVIADEISDIAKLKEGDSVLVVGLGNDLITPDSLGPLVLKKTIVTRHLKQNAPSLYFSENMREVSGIVPGVLGQTGLESFEITESVVKRIKPDAVLLIDSLAARNLERLTKAIQISDRGLIPGGGVGNSRAEISESTLGVKCISVGVPTVVSAESLVSDVISSALERKNMSDITADELLKNSLSPFEASLIVTPKDIRQIISQCARLLGYAVNCALHSDLDCDSISDWLNA